jgi:hypothetical protein
MTVTTHIALFPTSDISPNNYMDVDSCERGESASIIVQGESQIVGKGKLPVKRTHVFCSYSQKTVILFGELLHVVPSRHLRTQVLIKGVGSVLTTCTGNPEVTIAQSSFSHSKENPVLCDSNGSR